MNREQTIEAIKVMQAWVDGSNNLQYRPRDSDLWYDIYPDDPIRLCWNWDTFDYRIKPTAKIRPWTADEVPLGAWFRFKKAPYDRTLIGWVSVQADRDLWLTEREHSTDCGKTWLPCGVEESV